jgi:hypothetical protein
LPFFIFGPLTLTIFTTLTNNNFLWLSIIRQKKIIFKITIFGYCHTRFFEENRMHLICVPGSKFHTYDRLMSVISQDIAQNIQKRFINSYYTHEGRHEGLYMNNDDYEDATPSSYSTGV